MLSSGDLKCHQLVPQFLLGRYAEARLALGVSIDN